MENSDFHYFLLIERALQTFTNTDRSFAFSLIQEISQSNYIYLCNLVLNISISRPKLINEYVTFMCEQFEHNEKLKNIFVEELLNILSPSNKEWHNVFNYILNQLVEKGIVSKETIIEKFQTNIYFSHILMDNKLVLPMTKDNITSNFLRDINKYSENNWSKHIELIRKGVNPNLLSEIIFNDDVTTLQYFVGTLGKSVNDVIEPTIYDLVYFSKPINLIEYSALTGSLKCFKFLLLNGGLIKPGIELLAVAGGNTEIIRIIEQKNIKITPIVGLNVSIRNHHIDLLKWLLDLVDSTNNMIFYILKYSFYEAIDYLCVIEYDFNYDALCSSIQFNQFIIFKALVERGVDEYFSNEKSVMNTVCFYKNNNCFIDYLFKNLHKLNLNFNYSLRNGVAPLHEACKSGNLHAVNLLFNLPYINIDQQTRILN